MVYVLVVVVLAVVVLLVSAPLRRRGSAADATPSNSSSALAELEAARDAKYREIRDTELDHQTGKLSDSDFAVIDQALRAEAIAILRDLDRVRERDR
jgi:hypothetical protein